MDKQLPSLEYDNEEHNLLEPQSIPYSSTTVRRAFAVWMYCGQRNKFQHVCNYYHYLEAFEDTLSEESRAASRQHELDLFTSRPPVSSYLMKNFPTLYPAATQQIKQTTNQETNKHNINKKQNIKQKIQSSGTSKAEILEASIMIRDYCKQNMKSLKVFLKEFKEHTQRCGLTNTVGNIAFYIKRKIITSEIELEANYVNTLELMTRNYESNKGGDKKSIEEETHDNTTVFKSLILKKTNSLITTVDKNNTNESKNKSNKIFDVKINKVKMDNNKYENKEKNNSDDHSSYDFFDKFCYYDKHLKLRNKNFSDSNLIIREDFMKARKI
ncbi:hypothetical protein RR46_12807 [Papilio xuthus]|uniref:Uncharacterized protein n=1 Tax=Papilio xuthus TaxID=66420 RepID=A0A194PJZ5_PAPXU|nr:hypothetical protein RR46_12807 [Papilio xuthus]